MEDRCPSCKKLQEELNRLKSDHERQRFELDNFRQTQLLEFAKIEDERKDIEQERKRLWEEFCEQQEDFQRQKDAWLRDMKGMVGEEQRQNIGARGIDDKQNNEPQMHTAKTLEDSGNQTNPEQVISERTQSSTPSTTTTATPTCSSGTTATQPSMICAVCGDLANGMHYSALTCEGCKIFFRRHSRRKEMLKKCAMHVDSKDCMMDPYTRKQCGYCRMKKCLKVGMEIDRVWDKERCKTRKPVKKVSGSTKQVPKSDDQSSQEQISSTSRKDSSSSSSSSSISLLPPVSSSGSSPQVVELLPAHRDLMQQIYSTYQKSVEASITIYKTSTTMEQIRQMNLGDMFNVASQNNSAGTGFNMESDVAREELSQKKNESCENSATGASSGASASHGSFTPLADFTAAFGGDNVSNPMSDALNQYFMELTLLSLKHMIWFVKSFPFFTQLSCEDQSALVKEGFMDFTLIKFSSEFDHQTGRCGNPIVPGEYISITDAYTGGMEEFVSNIVQFAEKLVKLKLSKEQLALLLTMCIFTPDRPALSASAKQFLETFHEQLVGTLCGSARISHPDEPHFFPKVVALLTELRSCTQSFLNRLTHFKLQGKMIQPLLLEVLNLP